jgi:hypothetical protein
MQFKHVNELLFDIDVRVRYHDRRRAFFSAFRRSIAGYNVFAASAAAFLLWGILGLPTWIGILGAFLIALFNAYDIVTDVAGMERRHDWIYRELLELDEKIKRAKGNPDCLSDWAADLSRVERDEPPLYKAVYLQCGNEAAATWKLESYEPYVVSGFRAFFAHFFRMAETNFAQAKRA